MHGSFVTDAEMRSIMYQTLDLISVGSRGCVQSQHGHGLSRGRTWVQSQDLKSFSASERRTNLVPFPHNKCTT